MPRQLLSFCDDLQRSLSTNFGICFDEASLRFGTGRSYRWQASFRGRGVPMVVMLGEPKRGGWPFSVCL